MKLIKKVAPENPSKEFTDDVMKQLTVNVEQNLNADVSLTNLLNQIDDSLHPDFTENVLSVINSKYSISFQPIISKKAGRLFAVSMFVLVLLSVLFNNEKQTINVKKTYNLNFIYELIGVSSQSLSILFICIVSFSLLLIADHIIKNRMIH